ncbi:MAG: small multi-drug export protein [Clostridia bacterium]|nr:small multi-drug export protein [Clostridia bacterium]
MVKFIQELVGNDVWATILMSFFPLIELKGAIVFARGAELGAILSLLLSYIGSTLVFFPIYFLLRPILKLLKRIKFVSTLADKIERYFSDKAQDTLEKQKDKKPNNNVNENLLKILGVFLFVAIPLPMTGVWTGTAIAVFLNLKFKDSVLPVTIGNLIAGIIISLLAELCLSLWNIAVLDYLLYGLFALAILLIVVFIIKVSLKKSKKENE